jgi:hypothetical protein
MHLVVLYEVYGSSGGCLDNFLGLWTVTESRKSSQIKTRTSTSVSASPTDQW